MAKKLTDTNLQNLPVCAVEYIKLVIKKMRYRKKVRAEVMAELAAHFEDELRDCKNDAEKEQKAQKLIEQFGDAKLLGILLRRAKKRCRPLWRTIVARTFQTIGILILCFITYTIWFLTGKPAIKIDYLAQLNQMSRPQIIDANNAWSNYEKAIRLFVEPGEEIKKIGVYKCSQFSNLSEAEQKIIKNWVDKNQGALQELIIGSLKPHCYKEYTVSSKNKEKWLWGVLIPYLKPLRGLCIAEIWLSRMEVEQGNTKQALEDCLAVARVGKHLQENIGTLIEQLTGSAVSDLNYKQILYIAATKDLSLTDLKQLQQQLLQIYAQGYPMMDVRCEKLALSDAVQHIFTDGGPGGGHLIPNRLIYLMDVVPAMKFGEDSFNNQPLRFKAGEAIACTIGSMIHAGRDETIVKFNELYDLQADAIKITPYEKHIRNISSEKMLPELSNRYFLAHILTPSFDKLSGIAYRGKALYEATITVLAVLEYKNEKGYYPENLNELKEVGYIKEIPTDPFSNKPLVYRKTDSAFILYSVGLNFKDDGGQIARDDKGSVNLWADEDDAVFWPVQN